MKLHAKKNYFLPFWDHILAILISLLFIVFFGSWFQSKLFGFIIGFSMTLVMCGLIYSRMWKLSRKNTRYGGDLTLSKIIKYILPLVVFSVLLIFVYALSQTGVLPLKEVILKTYYIFPENLPREPVHVTYFDYLEIATRFWFSYFLGFTRTPHVLLLFLSPVLMLVSAILGFHFGDKNKVVLDEYIKASNKIKKKFND